MSNQEEEVSKIVIHYKDKKISPKVIKDGLALYTMNNDQDALAEFVGINDIKKIRALLNAVGHSLMFAEKQWSEMEAEEKEREGNKEK